MIQCTRLLVEEDVSAGPGPLSAAAGDDGAELYTTGGVEAAGFEKQRLNLYIIRKVSCAGVMPFQLLAYRIIRLMLGRLSPFISRSQMHSRPCCLLQQQLRVLCATSIACCVLQRHT